jgi:hypothetical protein
LIKNSFSLAKGFKGFKDFEIPKALGFEWAWPTPQEDPETLKAQR